MEYKKENNSLMDSTHSTSSATTSSPTIEKEETKLIPFKSPSTDLVPFKKNMDNPVFEFINLYKNIGKELSDATADIAINALENVEKVNIKIVDMLVDRAATTLFFTKAAVKGVKEVVELSGEVGKLFLKALWGINPKLEEKKDTSLIPINISMTRTEQKEKK